MPGHVLLQAATRRRQTLPQMPSDATYDVKQGVWLLDGRPLVRVSGHAFGGPTSKKNDIETGEDQKGE